MSQLFYHIFLNILNYDVQILQDHFVSAIIIFVLSVILILAYKELAKSHKELSKSNKILSNYTIINELSVVTKRLHMISVQYYFDHGLPQLKLFQIYSTSNTKSISNHDGKKITIDFEKLTIVSTIEEYRESALEFLSATTAGILNRGELSYTTESDVQVFVRNVMVDVIKASNLSYNLNCYNEIIFIKFYPHIWIIKTNDKMSPLCVIKVKKPSTNDSDRMVNNSEFINQIYDYMMSFEVYDGVTPVFGILTNFKEWHVIVFNDTVSKKVLFESDQANYDDNHHIMDRRFEYDCKEDDDHDIEVTSNLLVSSFTYDNADLFKHLVSILVKCYNRRSNTTKDGAVPLFPLLKPDRIVLKLKTSGISWVKFPKSIKLLSLQAPSTPKDWSELTNGSVYLLRDFGTGAEGKAWLGCNRAGQLVVMKFPILGKKVNKLESKRKLINECLMWNEIYGDDTAIIIKLNKEDVLVMPFVFCCCSSSNSNKEKKFNMTLQPSHNINEELLALDLKHMKELQLLQQYIRESKYCVDPEEVARSIIKKLAEKNLVHNDIAWRHIGVRPIYTSSSKFIRFEPILIDLSSVIKYAETGGNKSKLSSNDIFQNMFQKL